MALTQLLPAVGLGDQPGLAQLGSAQPWPRPHLKVQAAGVSLVVPARSAQGCQLSDRRETDSPAPPNQFLPSLCRCPASGPQAP